MRYELVSFKGHLLLYSNGEAIAHAYWPEEKAGLQALYEKLIQRASADDSE